MKSLLLLGFCLTISIKISAQQAIEISKDLELIKISKNAYIHNSYFETKEYGRIASNGFLYIQEEKAILFDTPMSDSLTATLLSYILDTMHLEIIGFVPNHWHDDCTQGMDLILELGIDTYSNILTAEKLKKEKLPLPKHTFSDSLELKIGKEKIFCYYLGHGHTHDNIVVWIPSEKTLFGGCMVKSLKANHMGYIGDADIEKWPITLQKVLDKFPEAEMIIPGHGAPGNQDLIYHTIEMIHALSE